MGARCNIGWAIASVVVLGAMLVPNGAGAATVVNGDFESGTLAGWNLHRVTGAGSWFAYKDTDAPIGRKRKPQPADPVQAPPEGAYAAITDEANPDTLILYQDIALEAGFSHRLSLLAYYDSYDPIAAPTPDTLSVDDAVLGKQKNQQYRIDVISPTAPLESLDPADILRTLLVTKPGDAQEMGPTRLSANLSAFAGKTVRLRIANAVHEEVFNAGVDAVSLSTAPPGQSVSGGRGSRRDPILFSFGRVKANRHTGTATLLVTVAGPGLVRAKGAPASAGAARSRKAGDPRKPIEPITVPVAMAKTVAIHLRPTPSARAILRQEHRLRVKIAVTFRPLDGTAETATTAIELRLDRRPSRRR
jgi:hypothetical protein